MRLRTRGVVHATVKSALSDACRSDCPVHAAGAGASELSEAAGAGAFGRMTDPLRAAVGVSAHLPLVAALVSASLPDPAPLDLKYL